MEKECKLCEKVFTLQYGNQKYCSESCKKLGRNARRREGAMWYKKLKPCRICGVGMKVTRKPKIYCDDCKEIAKYRNQGNISVLFGSLTGHNNHCDNLYAMTIGDMAKEFNISYDKMNREYVLALFKFFALFEYFYGKPDFGEPDNDCWDQLYNYIIEEEDHAPNPL